jgi:hypothetical protein
MPVTEGIAIAIAISNDVMMPLEAHSKEACRTRDARTSSWMLMGMLQGATGTHGSGWPGGERRKERILQSGPSASSAKLAQNSERAHQSRSIILIKKHRSKHNKQTNHHPWSLYSTTMIPLPPSLITLH